MRKILIAVGGVAVLLAATVGFTSAQTATPDKRTVIDLAASKLSVSGDDLAAALKQARQDLGLKRQIRIGKIAKDELTVAAKTLGVADAKALRKELIGSTLTAVAAKHNVQAATVANAIKVDVDKKIDSLNLTAERATKLKDKAHTAVDALMTRQF